MKNPAEIATASSKLKLPAGAALAVAGDRQRLAPTIAQPEDLEYRN